MKINKYEKVIFIFFLMIGCKHPESNNFDRYNKNKSEVELYFENNSSSKISNKEIDDTNIIKMDFENGVYKIPIFINDTKMNFIFDTGASDITISTTEAMFLYKQGTLNQEDIIGTQQYEIADGSIAEGTIINLRTVKIGNRTLENVKASIVHNMEAPLLLGQSALAQFGKVSIDYNRNEISFE
jgi:aspartyl protease family protein